MQAAPEKPVRSFFLGFIRNLLLMILALGVIGLFVVIFYPETLKIFAGVGFLLKALGLLPVIALALLATAIPRRR